MTARTLTRSIVIDARPGEVWESIIRVDTITDWYDSWDTAKANDSERFLELGASFQLISRRRGGPSPSAVGPTGIRNKAGQAFRPGLLLVELPGIEPALENALKCGDAGIDDARVRQTTAKHLGQRDAC